MRLLAVSEYKIRDFAVRAVVFFAYILKSGKPLDREILQKSAEYASRFTAEVIDYSLLYGDAEPRRDGVLLEGCLGRLYSEIGAK